MSIQGFALVAIATVLLGSLFFGIPVGRMLDVTAPGLLVGISLSLRSQSRSFRQLLFPLRETQRATAHGRTLTMAVTGLVMAAALAITLSGHQHPPIRAPGGQLTVSTSGRQGSTFLILLPNT